MKKSILLLTCLISAGHGQAKSYLDYLLNPEKFTPEVQACNLEEDKELKSQCVEALCGKGDPTLYPMFITDEEFEAFITKQPLKLTPEDEQKIEQRLTHNLKGLINNIETLEKKTPEELIEEASVGDKQYFITSLFMKDCTPVISPEKPIDERLSVTCEDPALDKHPLKQELYNNQIKVFQTKLDLGLMWGHYSLNEVESLVPTREVALKSQLDTLRNSNPTEEQPKILLEFMDKNWGKYSELEYTDKMRYLKGLSLIAGLEDPDAPGDYNLCRVAACEKMFDEIILKKEYQTKLSSTKSSLNDPDFKKIALASMKVQAALTLNSPSEKEIELFNKKKQKTIDSVLEYQQKIMSGKSFQRYKEKISSVVISLDDDLFQVQDYEPSEYESNYHFSSLIDMAYSGPEDLYYHVGANLGSPIALISDHYIDSKYKEFYDDGFDEVNVKYSLFSLKEHEYGLQILAHELGHHFSHLHMADEFSTDTSGIIDGQKACIKSRYEKFMATTGRDAGSFYLEEEYADEFGFAINETSSKILFCPFLLKPFGDDHLSLAIMNSHDNHPQDFWRTLNQLKSSGREIPLSCQELMLKNTSNYEYKKCL